LAGTTAVGAMKGEILWRSQQSPVFVSRSSKNIESTESTEQYRSDTLFTKFEPESRVTSTTMTPESFEMLCGQPRVEARR
jgi:hypothetical protein